MTSLTERAAEVLWPTYGPPAAEFRKGAGVRLWDAEGREHLDFLGGLAVVAAGHAHPAVVAAVTAQMATLGHVSNLYATEPAVALAERLVARFGGRARVFLSNSGAEANEAAIKLARRWGVATKGEGATAIVAADGGFHGRTLGALAATGKPAIRDPFGPLPGGFRHVPFGDAAALADAVDATTAAVLLEPVQGEAGVRVPPPGYLAAARRITRGAGALLVLDEVQSGVGRTGRFFAFEHEPGLDLRDARPDVVSLAKALGNGLPVGATIAADHVAAVLRPGDHGSTFGGGPVACAAALAVLDVVEPLLDGHVEAVGARLGRGLQRLLAGLGPGAEVRGMGLWWALDLGPLTPVPAADVVAAALRRGLVVNAVTPRAVRLAPPLVVTAGEVDDALDRLRAALEEVGACR